MSYRSQLNTWLADLKHDFGEYIPEDYPVQFFSSNTSDEALYFGALGLYNTVKAAKNSQRSHGAEDEVMYLVPHVESDGSFCYVNRKTGHVEVSMRKMPNGLFTYYGPKKYIEMLGGRGMLGSLLDRVEDGDFFRTVQKRAA